MTADPLTPAVLDDLERRYAAATPGEWRDGGMGSIYQQPVPDLPLSPIVEALVDEADAELIVALHTHAPALFATLRAVHALLDAWETDIGCYDIGPTWEAALAAVRAAVGRPAP